jgi:hypothetical protein
MRFARAVFRIAGVYGLIVLLPLYFLEERLGRDSPPAITHSEYYYGFIGCAIAFQIAFLIIGQDPVRYRPVMIAAILEKFAYGIAALVLAAQGRIAGAPLAGAVIDLVLGVLFVIAYLRTASARVTPISP